MAAVASVGREQAIKLLKEGKLPIYLGSPHPHVAIVEQEGKFRVRDLVVDRHAAEEAAKAAHRRRSPSWMPEHYYSLGLPTGTIHAEADTLDDLGAIMATMPWPDSW